MQSPRARPARLSVDSREQASGPAGRHGWTYPLAHAPASWPTLALMVAALVPRVLAVLFAKGHGMQDDHFCVIEPAERWVEGRDLPSETRTTRRNLLY